jgi:ammonium transporter, Amt family
VALFYGGLVRAKNMLSVLTQVMAIFCLISILWVVYGYSLAFGDGGGLNWMIGDLSKMFLAGITADSTAATFSDGVVIPEFIFVAFQLTFAAITVALITGGLAERVKFSALMVFGALWFTFSYLPITHMVWATGGYLFEAGDLDFAGGTVVHINSGIAALVGALVLGKRIGYGRDAMPPHSLPMTMIGASLLWVGWFGFNAGSNLEANGGATLAFINTILAPAAAGLWPGCSLSGCCAVSRPCWVWLPAWSQVWWRSLRRPVWSVRWVPSSSARLPAWSACGVSPA